MNDAGIMMTMQQVEKKKKGQFWSVYRGDQLPLA